MSFTGKSFSFNGNSFASFLKVLNLDHMSPPGSVRSIRVLGRDGAFETPTRFAPYDMSVECLIDGASYAAAIANRDTLLGLIATREVGTLVFDDMTGRYFPAKFLSAGPINRVTTTTFFMTLTFFIGDPFTHSTTETTITLGPTVGTGSPETVPTPVILGTADSYGVWILKHNVGAGGSKTFTLENATAKTFFTHTRTLSAGTNDWVRYTPKSQKIEYSSDAGANYARAPEGWDGAMPFLKPGLANQTKVQSTHPITVEIKYNAAFL